MYLLANSPVFRNNNGLFSKEILETSINNFFLKPHDITLQIFYKSLTLEEMLGICYEIFASSVEGEQLTYGYELGSTEGEKWL